MDSDRQRAVCDFYREEFVRYFDSLESGGFVNEGNRAVVERVYERFVGQIDLVCFRDEFPVLAETLLQNFDVLTRLSERQPRQAH